MTATAKNGDEWQGETNGAWFIYRDQQGNLYESKEQPAYRIDMTGCTQVLTESGKLAIAPIKRT
jgi:hypothetical protein